ncbi:MAG: UDP-N-acetylmuramoyl-L-alanyl-D-glutamate--2,6-diaminopimelate ligase [Bryobacteraceae bacterium]|nr:MAG: UDP-N-acetylmuramoyl-L-alanyl-D-glutamate--2,6-diaminopimelate ligase [Bryobacteraceae bacterium]
MKLAALLEDVPLRRPAAPGSEALEIAGLDYDSRRIQPGWLFFAFPGSRTSGALFAEDAVRRGAAAVVSELPAPADFPVPWIEVEHGRRALALMSRRFHGYPDERLRLTGVTGTNGKTTTVFAIDAMLRHAGRTTGMVGTVLYRVAGREMEAVNTTPESLDLVRLMGETLGAGGSDFVFEVSSHALALERVYGFRFHTAVFTNLTQDHLDFHGSMEAYFAAKHRLFEGAGGPPPRFAIVNADDPWSQRIKTAPSTVRWTYGAAEKADFRVVHVDAGFHGVRFDVEHPRGRSRIESPLCGLFNVSNLTAAFAAGLALGLEPEAAAAGLSALRAVPGRFERVDLGQPFLVIVDYAHTEDALRNLIQSARALGPRRIITVFGCGGDRDRLKRPRMGEAAAALSDLVIVTSDNPRSENPLDIINDILVGLRRHDTPHRVEADREKAIRLALEAASADDIVLIAGKGHEPYQVLADRTIAFDDREVARRVLESFGYRAAGEHVP